MSDDGIRPSSAVIRHDAADLALELAVLDRHMARLRARRQVIADELVRTLDRLEIREAAESPMELPRGFLDGPASALEVAGESPGTYTVSPVVPHGDRCMELMRSDDVCWRIKNHRGKHRGSRSMLKRAAHKRERRAEGKS
jgi:hypothetical protein